jgi:hypothetical protein
MVMPHILAGAWFIALSGNSLTNSICSYQYALANSGAPIVLRYKIVQHLWPFNYFLLWFDN